MAIDYICFLNRQEDFGKWRRLRRLHLFGYSNSYLRKQEFWGFNKRTMARAMMYKTENDIDDTHVFIFKAIFLLHSNCSKIIFIFDLKKSFKSNMDLFMELFWLKGVIFQFISIKKDDLTLVIIKKYPLTPLQKK